MTTPAELLKQVDELGMLIDQVIPKPKPEPSSLIVGVNGGSLSGRQGELIGKGIRSERLELPTTFSQLTLAQSKANGFTNQTVIIGNVDDGTLLSNVNSVSWRANALEQARLCQQAGGVALLECINEPQFKGGRKDPATYGAMYCALKRALREASITIPLGFTLFGNYQRSNGEWARMDWLKDAVKANPELPSLTDCLVHHTYGKAGEDLEGNLGTQALEEEHQEAIALGFPSETYVTEMGFQIGSPPNYKTVGDETEQAAQIGAVMAKLKSLGYVKGIWPYAMTDGAWSLKPPALNVIASFA